MSKDAPRGRLRRLSAEEIELWLAVAANVARRPGSTLPLPKAALAVTGVPAQAPVVAPAAAAVAPLTAAKLPPLAPIERKLKQRLARGRMTADAAIDLHGMTRERALGALRRFLGDAQGEGMRVVLVVTGKGGSPKGARGNLGARGDMGARGHMPFDFGDGVGVLKRSVPMWLDMAEFRPLVIGYEEAGRSHGGAGALYVRIRRRG